MDLNLNQLRIFHAVARLQSFTRASEALFLTQPGISKHVRQLEESLGIPLFDRLGRKACLTQAGEILYESTLSIFSQIETAKARIEDLKGVTGGKITIGASYTAGVHMLPQILGRYSRRYPDVEILLDIALSHRVAENILSNEFDIGIIGAPYDDKRLILTKFREDRLVVIMPADHPWRKRRSVGLAELADQPFILPAKGSGTRSAIEAHADKAGVTLTQRIAFGNTESVKKAVAAGMGVSIMSSYAVQNELAAGQLEAANLSGGGIKRNFYVVYHKDRYRTEAVRALIRFL